MQAGQAAVQVQVPYRARRNFSKMSRNIVLICVLLLAAAFIYDMVTPQRVVAAILLSVPVAVASLYLPRQTALIFLVMALLVDGAAGWFNGLRDGAHWDAASIANRMLVGFSIILVGALGLKARTAAQESGRLAAQQAFYAELETKNNELLRANATLAEREKVIRDIVYALSHDLRTPLAAAAMTLKQALDGKYGPLPEQYHDILRRSVESNNDLRRLADTLLLVARYESGEAARQMRHIALDRLVKSVAQELEPLSSAKHILVRVENGQPMTVSGDESELRRAITNLFANALKATPEGGTIFLRLSRLASAASIAVEDTGFGLPAEQVPSLFQRIPLRGTSSQGAGTGLGLYIVRRIAEEHGGSVTYRAREPHGSIFTLELPISGEAAANA